MKVKVLSLVIIILLMISGCSNQSAEKESSENTEENTPRIVRVMIEKVDSSSFYVVNTAEGEELQYAYYVYKNDEIIDKFSYKKDAHFTYTVKEPGSYKVKAYIKDKNDETESKYTETVEMDI